MYACNIIIYNYAVTQCIKRFLFTSKRAQCWVGYANNNEYHLLATSHRVALMAKMNYSTLAYAPNLISKFHVVVSLLEVRCVLMFRCIDQRREVADSGCTFVLFAHTYTCTHTPTRTGYVRLIMIITGWFFYDNVYVFVPLYALSAFLDGKCVYVFATPPVHAWH